MVNTHAHVLTIEDALEKIVSLTDVIYENECRDCVYTVNWVDILCELEEFASKGYDPSDIARYAVDIVQAVRDRAHYMQRRRCEFNGLTTTGEAAEYLTMFALSKLGIASINIDPQLFIHKVLNEGLELKNVENSE